jgi:hypothetical protein
VNHSKQPRVSGVGNEDAVGQKILDYLKHNPSAEDTLEGIAQWWLLEQQIRIERARVKAALKRMVERKLLIVRRGLDGRTHYRLNSL